MIRYVVDHADFRAKVGNSRLDRASKRTTHFVSVGGYEEPPSAFWSEVKPHFQDLQHDKCVFCERQFETTEFGKIEFDLEHFRPKSSVKAWPPLRGRRFHYDFQTGGDSPSGYFWLAYDLGNYAASCKVCNSTLKSNYFPVAGGRVTQPGDLAAEQALLCYPINAVDDDPETLISFIATTAIPASADDSRNKRGRVIIDFFRLNLRERLHRERAQLLSLLGNSLDAIDRDDADDSDRKWDDFLMTPRFPHLNCCRSFRRTWTMDKPLARQIWRACKAYVLSEKGTPPPAVG
ncbi:MAG: hypothetical protein RL367_1421 [Pseudomonadota bacterium]